MTILFRFGRAVRSFLLWLAGGDADRQYRPPRQFDPRWKHGKVAAEVFVVLMCFSPILISGAVQLSAGTLDMPRAADQAAENDSPCCGGFDELVGGDGRQPCTFTYGFQWGGVWIEFEVTTMCPPGFNCKVGTVDLLADGWHLVTGTCYNPKRAPIDRRIFPRDVDFDDDDMKTASHNGG